MSDIWAVIFRRDAATAVFCTTVVILIAVVLVGQPVPRDDPQDRLGMLIHGTTPILMSEPSEVLRVPLPNHKHQLQLTPQLLREGRSTDG